MRAEPTRIRATTRQIGGTILLHIAVGLLLAACASGPPPAVPPGPGQSLAEGEGFVVVQVDTELALDRIEANGRAIALGLAPGQHLWLVRMKAGKQRWTAVKLAVHEGTDGEIRPMEQGLLNDKEFSFDVEAGSINYPGDLIVQMVNPDRGVVHGVSVRNRNHSAIAIRKLMKTHADLVAAHPLRYAGASGDDFLQFYTREREGLRGSSSGSRAAAEGER